MKQKVNGWQLPRIEPRVQNLISALPLSFDNQITTSPQQFSMCTVQVALNDSVISHSVSAARVFFRCQPQAFLHQNLLPQVGIHIWLGALALNFLPLPTFYFFAS